LIAQVTTFPILLIIEVADLVFKDYRTIRRKFVTFLDTFKLRAMKGAMYHMRFVGDFFMVFYNLVANMVNLLPPLVGSTHLTL
jgi:hypothetical protein